MIKLLAISMILITSCEIAKPVPPFGTLKLNNEVNRVIEVDVTEYQGELLRLVKYKDENGCITNCFTEEVNVLIDQNIYKVEYNSTGYYGIKTNNRTIKCLTDEN